DDGIRGFHVTGVQTCALPISTSASISACGRRSGVVFSCRTSLPPYTIAHSCKPWQENTPARDAVDASKCRIHSRRANSFSVINRSEERRGGKGGAARGATRQS